MTGRDGSAPPNGVGTDGFSTPTYHELHPAHELSAEYAHGAPAEQTGPGSTRPLPVAGPEPTPQPRVESPPPAGEPPPTTAPTARRRGPSTRPIGTGDVTVTRAVVARSRYFSRLVAHKVISASEADGARESGLTAMIWNQVMSYGSDAMVTVALAGTVFFSAPSQAQRGNVMLYLLMTMAPFAVVAPVIGPALDRFQHGRRWLLAATAIGRGVLALVMAANFTDLYVLFPAALGSLVLSKAYAVIRSAAAPRLVPSTMTLVEANARLSMFGLVAAILGGGIVGIAIKVTGSYPFGLWITAAAFGITAVYSFRLPKIVDSLPPSARPRGEVSRPQPARSGLLPRLADWARRGFAPPVILALQGESTLRWLSGFLTMFMAFYVESVSHGWHAALSLAGVGAGTGLGNFLGTAVGTRLKLARPDLIILICTAAAAVGCLLAALMFNQPIAIAAVLVTAMANALSKLSLDAIIQRDVAESLRSSAFGRSETFLQLSWVFGAAVALLLPARNGTLGFSIAAGLTLCVAVFMGLRERAVRNQHHRAAQPRPAADGNLGA